MPEDQFSTVASFLFAVAAIEAWSGLAALFQVRSWTGLFRIARFDHVAAIRHMGPVPVPPPFGKSHRSSQWTCPVRKVKYISMTTPLLARSRQANLGTRRKLSASKGGAWFILVPGRIRKIYDGVSLVADCCWIRVSLWNRMRLSKRSRFRRTRPRSVPARKNSVSALRDCTPRGCVRIVVEGFPYGRHWQWSSGAAFEAM